MERVNIFPGYFFINALVILLYWGGGFLTALFALKLEKIECYFVFKFNAAVLGKKAY